MITFTVDTSTLSTLERLALEHVVTLVGAPSVEEFLSGYIRINLDINLDAAVADYIRATMPPAQIEAMRGAPIDQISATGDAAGSD